MGRQSGASPRPFVVSVVHTMNTMAGAMQFSRGQTSVVMPVSVFTVNKELSLIKKKTEAGTGR